MAVIQELEVGCCWWWWWCVVKWRGGERASGEVRSRVDDVWVNGALAAMVGLQRRGGARAGTQEVDDDLVKRIERGMCRMNSTSQWKRESDDIDWRKDNYYYYYYSTRFGIQGLSKKTRLYSIAAAAAAAAATTTLYTVVMRST